MISVVKPVKFLAAAALAAAALSVAPAALAEPLPGPNPIPVPGPGGYEQGGGCVTGEVMENGGCVSANTSPMTGGETRIAAPSVGGGGEVATTTTNSYLDPMHTVPNLNGDPCTGQWESTACYAMNFDSAPAVQPRSTLSSSP